MGVSSVSIVRGAVIVWAMCVITTAGVRATLAAPTLYVPSTIFRGPDLPVKGQLSAIDTETNGVRATVELPAVALTVAVDPAGKRVYVPLGALDRVAVLDAVTLDTLAQIAVGDSPRGIAIAPSGDLAYVSTYDVAGFPVSVIDVRDNSVAGTIPSVTDDVLELVLNPAGSRLYVRSQGSAVIDVIDTATNRTVADELPRLPQGASGGGIALAPDGSRLYATDCFEDRLYAIEALSGELIAQIAVPGISYGIAVHPDGTRVYVTAGEMLDELVVIDSVENAVAARVPVAKGGNGVAVHPDGTRIYVVSGDIDNGSAVTIVESPTNTPAGAIPIVGTANVLGNTFISPEAGPQSDASGGGGGCAMERGPGRGSAARAVMLLVLSLAFSLLKVRRCQSGGSGSGVGGPQVL